MEKLQPNLAAHRRNPGPDAFGAARQRPPSGAPRCGKLGLIVVDYLQLMSGSSGGGGDNRATELGEISRVA